MADTTFTTVIPPLKAVDNGDGTHSVAVSAVSGGLSDEFGGVVYENQDTAVADTARRFETTSRKLRDVVIQVTTYAQYIGDSANQRYLVQPNETLGFTKVDLSTLYFKNTTAGQNGTVTIIGVEE